MKGKAVRGLSGVHRDGTRGRPRGRVKPVSFTLRMTQSMGDRVKAHAAQVGLEPPEYTRLALLQAMGDVTIQEVAHEAHKE